MATARERLKSWYDRIRHPRRLPAPSNEAMAEADEMPEQDPPLDLRIVLTTYIARRTAPGESVAPQSVLHDAVQLAPLGQDALHSRLLDGAVRGYGDGFEARDRDRGVQRLASDRAAADASVGPTLATQIIVRIQAVLARLVPERERRQSECVRAKELVDISRADVRELEASRSGRLRAAVQFQEKQSQYRREGYQKGTDDEILPLTGHRSESALHPQGRLLTGLILLAGAFFFVGWDFVMGLDTANALGLDYKPLDKTNGFLEYFRSGWSAMLAATAIACLTFVYKTVYDAWRFPGQRPNVAGWDAVGITILVLTLCVTVTMSWLRMDFILAPPAIPGVIQPANFVQEYGIWHRLAILLPMIVMPLLGAILLSEGLARCPHFRRVDGRFRWRWHSGSYTGADEEREARALVEIDRRLAEARELLAKRESALASASDLAEAIETRVAEAQALLLDGEVGKLVRGWLEYMQKQEVLAYDEGYAVGARAAVDQGAYALTRRRLESRMAEVLWQ